MQIFGNMKNHPAEEGLNPNANKVLAIFDTMVYINAREGVYLDVSPEIHGTVQIIRNELYDEWLARMA